jgi:hypothetical protein
MDMLGLKGSVGDDIGTTNMGHKECGDRNDRNKEYNQCYTGKTSIFFSSLRLEVTIIKNCITCGTLVFCDIQCSGSRP